MDVETRLEIQKVAPLCERVAEAEKHVETLRQTVSDLEDAMARLTAYVDTLPKKVGRPPKDAPTLPEFSRDDG